MRSSTASSPLFDRVVSHIEGIGYTTGLLQRQYSFPDWFDQHNYEQTADAVAFGQQPFSYTTACLAVITPTLERQGLDLIASYRALGAPFAFEVRKDDVAYWRVTTKPKPADLLAILTPNDIGPFFTRERADLSPRELLRARNLSVPTGPQQLEMDWTLIPALESEIRSRLDPLLRDTLATARRLNQARATHYRHIGELYRGMFWLLAGKVLRDRGVHHFRSLGDQSSGASVIAEVAKYYGEPVPSLQRTVADFIKERIWNSLDLRHLSAEVLALIYENTLVDADLRKSHGIHATPVAVAKYIVNQLPFENLDVSSRKVVEPCCGHGTFLLASISRLRDLLPIDMPSGVRHTYLRERLAGFELDLFAAEVCRLSLMLADSPNRNGWKLFTDEMGDVLQSAEFKEALTTADVVLCNPPYRDLDAQERSNDPHRSTTFPIALLNAVLDFAPLTAILGFVLPRKVIDGRSFREIRTRLAKRFKSLEVTSLPDQGVFQNAEIEIALLIASDPSPTDLSQTSLKYGVVEKRDWVRFSTSRQVTRVSTLDRTIGQAGESLAIPDLWPVWTRMEKYKSLGDITQQVSRGVEWNIPYATNRQELVSTKPRPGFVRGLVGTVGEMTVFSRPQVSYLNADFQLRRNNAFDFPWSIPKVLINANRKSRGRWRVAAFADDEGLVCYQTLTAVWAKPEWPPKVVAAILNGIVANSYIASHEGARHITLHVLTQVPVPDLADVNLRRVVQLVDEFAEMNAKWALSASPTSRTLADVLNDLDAEILDSYRLTRDHEAMLREYLQFEVRAVPEAARIGGWWTKSFHQYEIEFSSSANLTIRTLDSVTRTELLGSIERLRQGLVAVGARELPSEIPGIFQYLVEATKRYTLVVTSQPGRVLRIEDVLSRSTVEYFS